jgi:hypothetical protein
MTSDEFIELNRNDDAFQAAVRDRYGAVNEPSLRLAYEDASGGAGAQGRQFYKCTGNFAGMRHSAHNAVNDNANCCAAFRNGMMAHDSRAMSQKKSYSKSHSCGFAFTGSAQRAQRSDGEIDDELGVILMEAHQKEVDTHRAFKAEKVRSLAAARETPQERSERLAQIRQTRDEKRADRDARKVANQELNAAKEKEVEKNEESFITKQKTLEDNYTANMKSTRKEVNRIKREALEEEFYQENMRSRIPLLQEKEEEFESNLNYCLPWMAMMHELASIGAINTLAKTMKNARRLYPTRDQLSRFVDKLNIFAVESPANRQSPDVTESTLFTLDAETARALEIPDHYVGQSLSRLKIMTLYKVLSSWFEEKHEANDNLLGFFVYVSQLLDDAENDEACQVIVQREFQGQLTPWTLFADIIEPQLEELTEAMQFYAERLMAYNDRDAVFIDQIFQYVFPVLTRKQLNFQFDIFGLRSEAEANAIATQEDQERTAALLRELNELEIVPEKPQDKKKKRGKK